MRLAVLAVLAPVACYAQAEARPRLVLDSDRHDFGAVTQGAVVSHRFKAENRGDAPLTLVRLDSTCGCTTTVMGKLRLEPGEGTELEVRFSSAGLRGPVDKFVRLVTDDPARPVTILNFHADVVKDIVVSDQEVYFRDLVPRDRRKVSVKLESASGQPIQVTGVVLSEAPWLGVATREEGRDLFVDFDLLARGLPPGLAGTDNVLLKVMNPEPAEIRLKVRWERLPPVLAAPPRVAWAETAGRDLTATVRLTQREHKPFRILSATTSNPLLKVLDLPAKAAARHRIRLALAASAPAGSYDEKVTLTLDAPTAPVLEIRVSAILR